MILRANSRLNCLRWAELQLKSKYKRRNYRIILRIKERLDSKMSKSRSRQTGKLNQ